MRTQNDGARNLLLSLPSLGSLAFVFQLRVYVLPRRSLSSSHPTIVGCQKPDGHTLDLDLDPQATHWRRLSQQTALLYVEGVPLNHKKQHIMYRLHCTCSTPTLPPRAPTTCLTTPPPRLCRHQHQHQHQHRPDTKQHHKNGSRSRRCQFRFEASPSCTRKKVPPRRRRRRKTPP